MFQGHLGLRYDIVIPGSEIPEWFGHQSLGATVNIKEPYSHLCNELIGIAVCVVFCSLEHHPPHQINPNLGLSCWLIANGTRMSSAPSVWGTLKAISSNLWLLYLLPQRYNKHRTKLLWECDANGFSQIGISIHSRSFEVKKCGLRMVYKKDIEGLNRTTAQCSNNSITSYEGLDVLHHNFDNSAVIAEVNEVKRSLNDYDRAGPSGEGSSNDVPHLKGFKGSQNL